MATTPCITLDLLAFKPYRFYDHVTLLYSKFLINPIIILLINANGRK